MVVTTIAPVQTEGGATEEVGDRLTQEAGGGLVPMEDDTDQDTGEVTTRAG